MNESGAFAYSYHHEWRAVDSAILFGAVAESAFRFPKAQITVVEPPEFCTLPSNAKLAR